MIFGNVRDIDSSFGWLPAPLKTAVEHLRNTDFSKLDTGSYEVQGRDIYVQVIDLTTKPVAETRPEVHVKHIDVHFLVHGEEQIGFASETGDNETNEDLLESRDLLFYSGVKNESWIRMTPGSFAIFLPTDVHRPACAVNAPTAIRKVVVKVRVALLQEGGRLMKTIHWGMIGCGAVTEVKSGPGFYKAENSALVAVTSVDPVMTKSFAQRHGVANAYDSTEDLLKDAAVEAVYIATPPSSHKPLALQAAKAGKHVYVEKPMAMRHAECKEIVDICEQQGVRLFVAFYRRAMPRFLKVKEWLDSGAIGDVRNVRAVQHQIPAQEDLSRATLPWRLVPEVSGGGKFLDMGIHTLDIFDFWFGAIEEVHGIAGNQAGLYDVEDTVTATWRHASGVQGYGSWCYVCGHNEDYVEIVGSKGKIELEFFSDKPLRLVTEGGVVEADIPNPLHVQQPFIQSIVDDLNGVAPCPGSIESAVRSTWVADEILKNYRLEKGY